MEKTKQRKIPVISPMLNFFKSFHKRFIDGSIGTKLSHVFMGAGSFYHKQYIKGVPHYHPVDYNAETNICDVEDSVIALIRFDNGSVLHVEASFTLNIKEGITTLQMFGEKGGAVVEPKLEIYKDMNDYMANITPIVEYNYDVFAEMFSGEVNHFYDCVKNGAKCKAPAEDGVMLMKILDAIYESALTGHEVKID